MFCNFEHHRSAGKVSLVKLCQVMVQHCAPNCGYQPTVKRAAPTLADPATLRWEDSASLRCESPTYTLANGVGYDLSDMGNTAAHLARSVVRGRVLEVAAQSLLSHLPSVASLRYALAL